MKGVVRLRKVLNDLYIFVLSNNLFVVVLRVDF